MEELSREFELPEEDVECLDVLGLEWETVREGGAMWLLLREFTVCPGYTVATTTAAISIPPTYPSVGLDMVYFSPALILTAGRSINAVGSKSTIRGAAYQRWSRHYSPANPWKLGEHNVGSHIRAVDEWIRREVRDV